MTLRSSLARVTAGPARAYVRHVPGRGMKPVLVRRLLEPALRRHPRRFVTRTRGGFLLGGSTQDMIQRYVYVFGVWEPALTAFMRSRLKPGSTLVDVGANIGYFSLLGSQLVGPTGHVVAVEALPATFDALQANLALNDTSNVRALNVAASAEQGELTLYGGEAHNSGTTTSIANDDLEELATVAAAPLVDLLTDEELQTARLVKIDVEGGELDVLRGLLPALGRMPDDLEIIVEVSPDELEHAGHRRDEPIHLLAEHGFHPYHLPNDYRPVSYLEKATDPPRRFGGPVDARMDLVFSRVDAADLS